MSYRRYPPDPPSWLAWVLILLAGVAVVVMLAR